MKISFFTFMVLVYVIVMGLILTFGIMGKSCEVAPLYPETKVADINPLSNLSVVDNQEHGATFDLAWEIACWRESRGDIFAYNEEENAKGIAQIRPIMVDDVNRIIRVERIAGVRLFKHDDAYDPIKARLMFDIFMYHYCPNGTPEEQYAKWNAGP